MSLFPLFGGTVTAQATQLPKYREVALDPDGLPLWKNGAPVIVEDLEAVRLWAMTALRTERYKHPIYSGQFGSELDALVGRGYDLDIQTAEAPRIVREALLQSPYITSVDGITTQFDGRHLAVTATVHTIYGDLTIGA